MGWDRIAWHSIKNSWDVRKNAILRPLNVKVRSKPKQALAHFQARAGEAKWQEQSWNKQDSGFKALQLQQHATAARCKGVHSTWRIQPENPRLEEFALKNCNSHSGRKEERSSASQHASKQASASRSIILSTKGSRCCIGLSVTGRRA